MIVTEVMQKARDEWKVKKKREEEEREAVGRWFEAWRKNVIDTVNVSILDNTNLWRKVTDDRARWNAYAELTINAWEKGMYVWYCAFCNRIEYTPSTDMFGFACDYAEGTGSERCIPDELHIQPQHNMPVPPEDWAMITQGPICGHCRDNLDNEYEIYKRPKQRVVKMKVKNPTYNNWVAAYRSSRKPIDYRGFHPARVADKG